jgi:hypothetical protein
MVGLDPGYLNSLQTLKFWILNFGANIWILARNFKSVLLSCTDHKLKEKYFPSQYMDFEHFDKISQVPKPWFDQVWTYVKPQVLRFKLHTLQWSCSQSCALSGNVQVCSSSMGNFWVFSVGNVLHHLPGQSLQTLFWPTLTGCISQNIGIWTILPVGDLLQIVHTITCCSCISSEIPGF